MTEKSKGAIFFMAADRWGSGWYRCGVPSYALVDRGYKVIVDDSWHDEALEECDVIVFQKQWHPSIYEKILEAKARGIRTVFELDDDMWRIHPNNPARAFWSEPEHIRGIEACLSACDVATTTTKYLASLLSHFNPNVVVLSNMLPLECWIARRTNPQDGRLIVGWQGGASHWTDLQLLHGIVEQILEEFENIDIHVVGMAEYPFRGHPRLYVLQPVRPYELAKLIIGFDIGLAPLADNSFNLSRSDIKFLEYAILGIPCIASKVGSYTETMKHGKTGFLAQNPKDWLKCLKRLIEDENLRKEMGLQAKKYALTRIIDKNIWMWEKAYGFIPDEEMMGLP